MRQLLLSALFLTILFTHRTGAQRILRGIPQDSVLISFCDSIPASSTGINYVLDTSHTQLWRTDSSSKPAFSGVPGRRYGIMTDTALPYPVGQSEWFSVRLNTSALNPIVEFRHRFQTDSGRDGGVVEYSFDSSTWSNVVGGCFSRVWTDSFYSAADTLPGGVPAFSGSAGWKTSRFQFFQGLPVKETGTCSVHFPLWIRFRFSSDSTAETLAGWQIQSVKLIIDKYNGGVIPTQETALEIHPNPSGNGLFHFPALTTPEPLIISVTDALGRLRYHAPYSQDVDLSALPAGQYFYRAGSYRGRLLRL